MDSTNSLVNMNLTSEDVCQLHTASAPEGGITSHGGDTASSSAEGVIRSHGGDSASLAENGDLHLVDSWTWYGDANTTINALEDVVAHSLLDPTSTIDEPFPRRETSVQGHSLPLISAPSIGSVASSLEVEAGDAQSCSTETDLHMPALSDPAWGPEEMLRGVGQGYSINEAENLCNQMNEARREREKEGQFRLWLEQSGEQRGRSDNDGVSGSGEREMV